MFDAWGALARAGLSRLISWAPGIVLRSTYPISTRRKWILLFAYNGGPSIQKMRSQMPRVYDAEFSLINLLPFPITVSEISWQIVNGGGLGSAILGRYVDKCNAVVGGHGVAWLRLDGVDLDHSSIAILEAHPSECVLLSFQGTAHIKCVVGDFEKYIQVSTYANLAKRKPVQPDPST